MSDKEREQIKRNAAVKTDVVTAASAGGIALQNTDKMGEADKKRLQNNIHLAGHLGADITIIHGEDVSFQIAEYARISGVTKIVIGRSNIKRRHFWNKPTLTEKLIEIAPNLDIHIIPDGTVDVKYKSSDDFMFQNFIVPYPKDVFIMLAFLMGITLLGLVFYSYGFTDSNIINIYINDYIISNI